MLLKTIGLLSRSEALRRPARNAALLSKTMLPAALALGTLAAPAAFAQYAQQPTARAVVPPVSPVIPVTPGFPVTTYGYNNQRTGANINEKYLAPAGPVTATTVPGVLSPNLPATPRPNTKVDKLTFGKLFTRQVDGAIFGQPLYVPGVTVSGKGAAPHNMVIVATSNNSIYAFDADDNGTANPYNTSPLWVTNYNLTYYGIGPIPATDINDAQFGSQVGVLGTPVIDINTKILYFVVNSHEGLGYFQRVHAIDLTTGKDVSAPFALNDNTPIQGGGVLGDYDPLTQNPQAALMLDNRDAANPVLYVATGSYGSAPPQQTPDLVSHGYLLPIVPATKTRPFALINTGYNSTANGNGGGIMNSGAGPSQDSQGNLYIATSSGDTDTDTLGSDGIATGVNASNSIVKLAPVTLAPLDFFTPYNVADLNDSNHAIGTGGVLILPDVISGGRHLALAAGYEGSVYLLERYNLGGFSPDGNNVVTELTDAVGGVFGMPAFFQTGPNSGNVYYQGVGDVLKSFEIANGQFTTDVNGDVTPLTAPGPTFTTFGATPIVSANGQSNGIVWTVENHTPLPFTFGNTATPRSVLRAYDALTLAPVWSNIGSGTLGAGARDEIGNAVRNSVPTVVNGKVYVAGDRQLAVFGLSNTFYSANPIAQNQADYFAISGTLNGNSPTELQTAYFSVTPVGPDGQPIDIVGPIRLSAQNITGSSFPLGIVTFGANSTGTTSNQIFTYRFGSSARFFNRFGFYNIVASDAYGHTSPVRFSQVVSVGAQITNDWDHFNISMPTKVKVGRTVMMTITAVTVANTPVNLYDYDNDPQSPTFRKALVPIPVNITSTYPGSTFPGAEVSIATGTVLRPLQFSRITSAGFIKESQITVPVRFTETGKHIVMASAVDYAVLDRQTPKNTILRNAASGAIVVDVVP